MEKKKISSFMVIDDSHINIMLAETIIRKVIKFPQIKTFTLPPLALKFIEEEYDNAGINIPTLLLLDIHMPAMNGFEFLNRFKNFSNPIKEQFKIFILSSYIDCSEMQRAVDHCCVTGYLSKPLTIEMLKQSINKSGYKI